MNIKGVNRNQRRTLKISNNSDRCDCLLHDAIIHEQNKAIEKNKLLNRSGKIDQLKSLNDNDMPAYFNISNKTKTFKCGIRDVDSSRNKYTMHIPYIKNKEMELMVNDGLSNGAYSDRGNLNSKYVYNFPQTINKDKDKNNYGHINNKYCINRSSTPGRKRDDYSTLIMNNEAILNSMNSSPIVQPEKKCINIIDENNDKNKKNNNNLRNIQPLYKELGKQKNRSIDHFLLKNNSIIIKNSKSNQDTQLQKTNFLNMQFKDKIPLQYPFVLSNQNNQLFKGKNNRYLIIMNELHRVKYIISIEKDKEHDIMKEFFIKNGIYNKLSIQEKHFENFAYFLKGKIQLNNKTISKPFKDIIIDIIEDNFSDNSNLGRSTSPKEKDRKNNAILNQEEKNQVKNSQMNEIYSKVPLIKQNNRLKINKNKTKELSDIVKDLEHELNQIKNPKLNIRKRIYTTSPFMESQTSTPRRAVNLTQFQKLIDSNNDLLKKDEFEFILSNQKIINNRNSNGVLLVDKMCSTIKPRHISKSNSCRKMETSNQQFNIKAIKSKMKLSEFLYLNKAKHKIAINNLIQNLDIAHILNNKNSN